MLLSKLSLKIIISVAVLLLIGGMASCSDNTKVITEASEEVENRDYKKALESILSLSDKNIANSDTLTQLLATAYYGLTMQPVNDIALNCYDMDLTPDKSTIVFTDFQNGLLNLYAFPEMKFQRSISLPDKAYNIDISPDGSTIAAAMADKSILLYDVKNGTQIKTLGEHSNRVRDVAFRDDSVLFSCGNDQRIAAWNVSSAEQYWRKHQNSKNIKSLQLSKDRTKLVTASNDGSACVVNAGNDRMGAEELRVVHGPNYVNDATLSPDNKYLVTVSGDQCLKIWNVADGQLLTTTETDDPLGTVDISPDGKYIITGGQHSSYILSMADGKILAKLPAVNRPVWCVKFISDKEFAFADDTRFWRAPLLTTEELLTKAREVLKTK